MIPWPRGGDSRILRLSLGCPAAWRRDPGPASCRARLVLRWWADRAELRVDGMRVHAGDLFDTACRWELPRRWWDGEPLQLELELRSPLHDDGALVLSRIEREPLDPADPLGLLQGTVTGLRQLRRRHGRAEEPGPGPVHLLGHAHLDLAWLWPVADTWRAAERTFRSALDLLDRHPELHFGHSTPALYAWLEQHRPALFRRIRRSMRSGRWEPLNGPWVESDCVLIDTASLLRQFQEGQHYSRRTFPEWSHRIAWLPDSFGFSAGLPAVARATGVRWFCTHKLAWNATNPFPHRLFRWRSRCGSELLALMSAPIGTDGDPLAIERQRIDWQRCCGAEEMLWLPGVGDHGGGPTAEMLEQLELWRDHPATAPQRHGPLRSHLGQLEPLARGLPVWRDELYLELHRGCATSRPDQKRHNRTLERLLREAELVCALAAAIGSEAAEARHDPGSDWHCLLFQQFHDILPGTSIPEVFEQAGRQWRAARRRSARGRDAVLHSLLRRVLPPPEPALDGGAGWVAMQLQPLPPAPRTLRLPAGRWTVCRPEGERGLETQSAPGGGQWVQLPGFDGIEACRLRRVPPPGSARREPLPIVDPVQVQELPPSAPGTGGTLWRLSNGRLAVAIGRRGIEQLWDGQGRPQLTAPLAWCRWRDRGEYWDAWDIAADHRDHPLPWSWEGAPQWVERGPLCGRFVWRGRCGRSPVRLDGRLLAGSPWLDLVLSVRWRQRHELLRLEVPLRHPARRWAADTPGGVIERPARTITARERARWEVAAISWLASVHEAGSGGGVALLLDGPQGVSGAVDRLGVSLLRGPTWPDPGADNGWRRQRLGLMPCPRGWRPEGVPVEARRLREPLWIRPLAAAVPEQPRQGAAAAGQWRPLPALGEDLRLISLRPDDGHPAQLLLCVQNEGPCRRRLSLPSTWRLLARVDGLGGAEREGDVDPWLRPWELGFWRLDGQSS